MNLKDFYDEVYKNYKPNADPRIWQIFAIKVINESNLKNNIVLDVGAGYGYILRSMEQIGFIPHAIDVSNECVSFLKDHGINSNIVDISTDIFPFNDQFFDYIVFTEVIEHLVFPNHALAEIFRVLKPGGRLLISTHNSFNLYMRLKYLIGQLPSLELDVTEKGQHVRLYSYRILSKMLQMFGFKERTNRSWFRIWRISFFVPHFLTSLLSRHLLLVYEKPDNTEQ